MAVINDIITTLKNLQGSAHLKDIYNEYKRLTGNVTESSIRKNLQEYSSDTKSYIDKGDFFFTVEGLGKGIWGLRHFYPESKIDFKLKEGNLSPKRKNLTETRIIRDTVLAKQIKNIVGNKCQLCENVIKLINGNFYSESHHIQPLGKPHNGPDVKENIIVLCPNCHVKCDYGTIALTRQQILNNFQGISERYISYHNSVHKTKNTNGLDH